MYTRDGLRTEFEALVRVIDGQPHETRAATDEREVDLKEPVPTLPVVPGPTPARR